MSRSTHVFTNSEFGQLNQSCLCFVFVTGFFCEIMCRGTQIALHKIIYHSNLQVHSNMNKFGLVITDLHQKVCSQNSLSVCENCSKTNKHIYYIFFQIESDMYSFFVFFSKIYNCFLKGIQKPCSLALLELLQFCLLFLQPQLGYFFLCDHKPRTSTFVSIVLYNCSTIVRWKSSKVAEG